MTPRLWGITTYFNPSRSTLRRENYRAFRARSLAQGLRLVTVELSFGEQGFELADGVDAELLIQRRSDARLWQKERLLNIALDALPDECAAVCWIDADVLLEDDDWIADCERRLEASALLQPFSKAIRLPRGGVAADYPASELDARIAKGSGDGTYSDAVCMLATSTVTRLAQATGLAGLSGTTGYAWCARREVLRAVGFYDRCVVGGADRELAVAALFAPNRVPRGARLIHYARLREHIAPWHARFHAAIDGRVSYRPGVLHHLWHGDAKDRQYRDRHAILEEHGFDPERDLALDAGGCWRWSTDNRALVDAVEAYFASRNETE